MGLETEYCAKGSSTRLLTSTSSGLKPMQALNIIKGVLSALSHAHSNGIHHGNVTLDDIMLTAGGTVRLKGFGHDINDEGNFKCGLMMEKGDRNCVEFKEPESQKVNSVDRKFKSDIWALGICLLVLLTRMQPCDKSFRAKGRNGSLVLDVKRLIHDGPLSHVGKRSKALLCRMLDVNYESRISARQALELCAAPLASLTPKTDASLK